GRFQRGATGHVEDHLVGVFHGLELLADLGEGLLPAHCPVGVAGGVITHGVGQAALVLQVEIGPVEQFGDAVGGEEFRAAAAAGVFPGGGLGAVLAERQRARRMRLGPGAADAGEAVDGLVLLEQQRGAGERNLLADQDVGDRIGRAPATGGGAIRLEGRLAHVVLLLLARWSSVWPVWSWTDYWRTGTDYDVGSVIFVQRLCLPFMTVLRHSMAKPSWRQAS